MSNTVENVAHFLSERKRYGSYSVIDTGGLEDATAQLHLHVELASMRAFESRANPSRCPLSILLLWTTRPFFQKTRLEQLGFAVWAQHVGGVLKPAVCDDNEVPVLQESA